MVYYGILTSYNEIDLIRKLSKIRINILKWFNGILITRVDNNEESVSYL